MSQRYDVLRMLRAAGPVGVHTNEIRAVYVANPSERIRELEAEGHVISHTRERLRGSAVGTRYVLGAVSRAAPPAVGSPEQGAAAGVESPALALDISSEPICAIYDADWEAA